MSKLSRYNIAFKGLAQGKHEFLYELDKSFFEAFENSMIEDGDAKVKLVLEKQSSLMVLWFHISGTVFIQCDRCLDYYSQPISGENRIYIKFGEDEFNEGDEVIWVSVNDYQINVSQLMYEFVSLALPIRHVHPDDENGNSECNPEMLSKLNIVNDDNYDDEEEQTDSRWDDLKKLLDNE